MKDICSDVQSDNKRSLLQRWGTIEELENAEDGSASFEEEFRALKEEWFSDAFLFLDALPKENHCWCMHKDISWPLLEPFHNYRKGFEDNVALGVLWKRMSHEMRGCIQCVVQYHKTQDFYQLEFMEDIVKPLLDVLRMLDNERVEMHLTDICQRVKANAFDPCIDSSEVICLMFEVLSFPPFLEDVAVSKAFTPFLQYVHGAHDISLAGGQRYPGLYTLFFHPNQDVRRISIALANPLGSFKNATELEPVQPFLEKCVKYLEYDLFDIDKASFAKTRSKAVQKGVEWITTSMKQEDWSRSGLSRESVWIGLQTLLGLLKAQALEEGVVERHPSFVSMVLNHVSEATSVFWNALRCLKLLLEVLGYKLWLKTTFSPGVMRNTLLSQCFHTHEEKIHKAVFDLFQPFLQSLESLQDGEYERQRRHLIYFLLQQVPFSKNFSALMSKKACQIAFYIVLGGYRTSPPSPPLDCVHVWGPPLITTVKDSSLHPSLREPAVELFKVIIVEDATALALLSTKRQSVHSSLIAPADSKDICDEETDGPITGDVSERQSCWDDFNLSSQIVDVELETWRCVPLLWLEVLECSTSVVLPDSLFKAVLWGASRLSVIQDGGWNFNSDLGFDFNGHMFSSDFASALRWAQPKGCDDGADGRSCMNVVNVESLLGELINIFKRCTSDYILRSQDHYKDHWKWDWRMAEALILLLLDHNHKMREFGRGILQEVSKVSGLEDGLQFLCSCEDSMVALCRGLRHATNLMLAMPILERHRSLEELLFISLKLLTLDISSAKNVAVTLASTQQTETFQQGGFLRNPLELAGAHLGNKSYSSGRDLNQRKYVQELSSSLWPLLKRLLLLGTKNSEIHRLTMTCTRVLDLLPATWRFLSMNANETAMDWFEYFIEWGKIEQSIIKRRWNQALWCLIEDSSKREFPVTKVLLESFAKLLLPGSVLDNDARQKFSLLYTSICSQSFREIESDNEVIEIKIPQMQTDIIDLDSDGDNAEVESCGKARNISDAPEGFIAQADCKFENWGLPQNILDAPVGQLKQADFPRGSLPSQISKDPILLHDEFTCSSSSNSVEMHRPFEPEGDVRPVKAKHVRPVSVRNISATAVSNRQRTQTLDKFLDTSVKCGFENMKAKPLAGDTNSNNFLKNIFQSKAPSVRSKLKGSSKLESLRTEHHAAVEQRSLLKPVVSNQIKERVKHYQRMQEHSRLAIDEPKIKEAFSNKKVEEGVSSPTEGSNLCYLEKSSILKELVSETDVEKDPLERALENAKSQSTQVPRAVLVHPKRQLIRLEAPREQSRGTLSARLKEFSTRAPPPRLDIWYKSILALDYFAVAGIDATSLQNEKAMLPSLVTVPLTFESSKQYIDIFKPLLLEEFKAQLQRSREEMLMNDDVTVGILRLMSLERIDDFQLGRFMAEGGYDGAARVCHENDLLLLSKKPLQSGPQSQHIIAKVEGREKEHKSRFTILVLKFYFATTGNMRLTKVKQLLVDGSKWHVTRLLSITPQLREFQALSAITRFPLLPIILCPKPTEDSHAFRKASTKSTSALNNLPEQFKNKLKEKYNESQLNAIEAAIWTGGNTSIKHDVSLVQGPPGTGKTSTIIAIISALLASINCSRSLDTRFDGGSVPRLTVNSSSPNRTAAAIARSWQDAALARELAREPCTSSENLKKSGKGRILVCAQSNAAVDELVSRLCKSGLYDLNGSFYKPAIVRVGNAKTIHPDSMPVFIDNLVEQQLDIERTCDGETIKDKVRSNLSNLRARNEEVAEKIKLLESRHSEFVEATGSDAPVGEAKKLESGANVVQETEETLKADLINLHKERRQICAKMAVGEKQEKRSFEEGKARRKSVRMKIIQESEIVITTLSGCGGDVYSACMESFIGDKVRTSSEKVFFNAVIIDEAAQALEPATLIPLQLLRNSVARCIMIGDPKQLPATVLSQAASKMSYECSMFERFQKNGFPVTMLTVQYRMHPEICQFPSSYFYEKRLIDAEMLTKGCRVATFHKDWYFGPYVFFNVVEGRERSGVSASQSLCNEEEVAMVLEIFQTLRKRYPSEIVPGRIGIITPYKQQLALLREKFTRTLGSNITAELEFNTVDGFQGREVDILILSTVRASSAGRGKATNSTPVTVGFLGDVRRMNVVLTRARFSLWIVGNAETLQVCPPWASLINDAQKRRLLFSVQRPYSSFFNSISAEVVQNAADKLGLSNRSKNSSLSRKTLALNSVSSSAEDFNKRSKKTHSSGILSKVMLREYNMNFESSLSANKNQREENLSKPSFEQEEPRIVKNSARKFFEGSDRQLATSKDIQSKVLEDQNQVNLDRNVELQQGTFSTTNDHIESSAVGIERFEKKDNFTKEDQSYDSNKILRNQGRQDLINAITAGNCIMDKDGRNVETHFSNVNLESHKLYTDAKTYGKIESATLKKGEVDILSPKVDEKSFHQDNKLRPTQSVEGKKLDINTMRKRQREEVAAIMPSGLFIDAKKQVSVKRAPRSGSGRNKHKDVGQRDTSVETHDTKNVASLKGTSSNLSMTQTGLAQNHNFDDEWELFQKVLAETKKSL